MTGAGRDGDRRAGPDPEHGITPNPGGSEDPLGESVAQPGEAPGRVFEPRDVRLVIGRFQDAEREVHLDRARQDGVPVHRRLSGGGAVVLAPGMLVIALRLPPSLAVTWSPLTRVAERLASALQPASRLPILVQGHGDLALAEAGAVPRKVLGASLRQTARASYYLGVLLLTDAGALMERYLPFPSRTPEYRGRRQHREFCSHLGAAGLGVAEAQDRLTPILDAAGSDAQAWSAWVG